MFRSAVPSRSAGERANSRRSPGLSRSPPRYLWAMLIARIYEVLPLVCTQCGTEMRLIAFVTDTASVTRILEHIGEPAKPPRLGAEQA